MNQPQNVPNRRETASPAPGRLPGRPQTPGPGGTTVVSFGDVMRMLRRHPLLILMVFVIIAGAGTGFTLYMYQNYPTYRAEVHIQVESGQGTTQAGGISETLQLIQPNLLEQFIGDQISRLRDDTILRRALNPQSAAQFEQDLSWPSERTIENNSDIQARARRIEVDTAAMLGAGSLDEQAAELKKRIGVNNPFRTSLIVITLTGRNRQLIADITNAVADSYMLAYREDQTRRQARRLSGLERQLADVRNRVTLKSNELSRFKEENRAIRLAGGSTDWQRGLELLQRALAEAKLQLIAATLDKQQAEKPAEESLITPQMELILQNDPVLNNHKAVLSNLQRQRQQLLERFTGGHDMVQNVESQIATTEGLIENRRTELANTLIAQQKEQIEVAYVTAQSRFDQINREYQEAERKAADLDRASVRYDQLVEEMSQLTEEQQEIQSAVIRTQIVSDVSANNVAIALAARVPPKTDKDGPKILLYVPGSILLGLILSVALALLVELIDNRVRTPLQVMRLVNLPVLGTVPDSREDAGAAKVAALPLAAQEAPQSLMAESFRQLRTALMYSTDTDLRTLLITSGRAGVGKSVVASNLAVTLAQGGARTLLIDTNFRRPIVHRTFDLPNSLGLSSVLARLSSFEEAVRSTAVANLDVLSCGPVPPSPADLLGSEAMQNLLEEAKARYDNVILDGAPTLIVSDAHVLCSMVDGVALVISASQTPRGVATRANRTLQGLKARVVGAVLNRVRATKGGYFREAYKSYYSYAQGGNE